MTAHLLMSEISGPGDFYDLHLIAMWINATSFTLVKWNGILCNLLGILGMQLK